jgi:hypothetical protein
MENKQLNEPILFSTARAITRMLCVVVVWFFVAS